MVPPTLKCGARRPTDGKVPLEEIFLEWGGVKVDIGPGVGDLRNGCANGGVFMSGMALLRRMFLVHQQS